MPSIPDTVRALEPAVVDPEQYAAALWRQLAKYQPAVAGALAIHLRNLPDDWAQRQFHTGRPEAVLTHETYVITPYDFEPEIAPYRTTDADECKACDECWDLCRWHRGYAEADGGWFRRLLDARTTNPDATVAQVLEAYEREQHEACSCDSCTAQITDTPKET